MSTQRAAQAIYLVPVDVVASEARFSAGAGTQRETHEISLPGYEYDAWTAFLSFSQPDGANSEALFTLGETPEQATLILPVSVGGVNNTSKSIPDSPAQTPFRIPTGKLYLSRVFLGGGNSIQRAYYRITLWRYVTASEARGLPPR